MEAEPSIEKKTFKIGNDERDNVAYSSFVATIKNLGPKITLFRKDKNGKISTELLKSLPLENTGI